MRPFLPFAAVLTAAFLLGCQDQGSEPVGPESEGPQFAKGVPQSVKPQCPSTHPSCKPKDGGNAERFDVTIKTIRDAFGPVSTDWTSNGVQVVQESGSKNWLHIFDSGGNGTRGRPNYANAAFGTKIFLRPVLAGVESCIKDPAGMSEADRDLLFSKLNQDSFKARVFDFQVDYSIAETGGVGPFFFFRFRWEETDGSGPFLAEIGPFPPSTDRGIAAFFSLDNPPRAIDDPTATRVFTLTGGMAIAKELDKNKVIRTLACENEYDIELTVAPLGTL